MTTFVLPADRVHESAALCDYLIDRVDSDDTVHAVSTDSDANSPQARRDSEDAQNAIYARLGAVAVVEQHTEAAETQSEALRSVAERTGAGEIVINHSPDAVGERDFDQLLRDSPRPIVVVPGEAN